MADIVLFFASNADTMIATKALKDAGVTSKMIPRPAGVATEANLCLSIDASVENSAKSALAGAGVNLGGVAR